MKDTIFINSESEKQSASCDTLTGATVSPRDKFWRASFPDRDIMDHETWLIKINFTFSLLVVSKLRLIYGPTHKCIFMGTYGHGRVQL